MKDLELRQKLNEEFDPTDSDRSMKLAWSCLMLMETAQRVIEAYNGGLGVGRDDASRLSSQIITCAQTMNLIDYQADCQTIEIFRNKLLHKQIN